MDRRPVLLFLLVVGTAVSEVGACALNTNGAEVTGAQDGSTIEAMSFDASPETAQDRALPNEGGDGTPDDATPGDATGEAACEGVVCNGICTNASDCRTCPGAPLLCGPLGTCSADCHGCQDPSGSALPIECFACDSNHQNPVGTCQYHDAGSYCLSGDYAGQYDGGIARQCGCSSTAPCPGATQVCVPLGNVDASFCLTCGEPTIGVIQGQPCQGGGTCDETQATCQ